MLAWALLSAALAGASPPAVRQAPDERVVGEMARFFRGDRTLVNGFVRVPHRMLSGLAEGLGRFAAYRVELRVTDDHGTVLASDTWSRRLPWRAAAVTGAESVEPFAFAVAPGSYAVHIAVQDSGSGASETIDLPLTGFGARPRASDLLLAYGIRQQAGDDTTAAAGEVRKGDLFIASAPDVTLTPDRAVLWYYCEVYRDSTATVPWLVRVMGRNGNVVVTSRAARTTVAAGGGRIAASIDLAGLPPGDYTLALAVGAGADTVVRTAPFRMGGFATERAVAAAALGAAPPTRDRFSDASAAKLDSLFEPLVYLAQPEELKVYAGLTVDGKRRFLRDFWRRRDPTPGSLENEAETGFYERIAEANRQFREGGAGQVPGWRTDRGRVYIRYGPPDEVRREPLSGPDRPWEAWKYTRERSLKFVFLDLTRLGNYSLIYSNDKLERNPGDWTQLLSPEAIQEISSF
jgi:GWxTD domain-containing protein